MNEDGAADVVVDVQAALEIPGAFWGAIASGVVGIGLLIIGILFLRRGHAQREQQPVATGGDSMRRAITAPRLVALVFFLAGRLRSAAAPGRRRCG